MEVTNAGDTAGEEVVQLYIQDVETSVSAPKYQLFGVKRVTLEAGAQQSVEFSITPEMMELVNEKGERVLEKGTFKVYVGGSTPHERNVELGKKPVKSAEFQLR